VDLPWGSFLNNHQLKEFKKLRHVVEGSDCPRVFDVSGAVLDVDFAERSSANDSAKEWEALKTRSPIVNIIGTSQTHKSLEISH